jgi:ATP-dependent Clp protease ATP-binding subunit ClpB
MRPERFTTKAQEVMQGAQTEARRRDHQGVDVEHLALALLGQQDGMARPLLDKIGADSRLVTSRLEDELRTLPRVQGGEQHLAQRLAKLMDRADDEARRLKDEYVSSEHLLVATAQDKGAAGEAMRAAGATPERILGAL